MRLRPKAELHGAPAGEAETVWRNELAGLTLTMLLYLGGEPDLVRNRPSRRQAAQGQDRAHRPRTLPRSRRADRPIGRKRLHTRNRAVGKSSIAPMRALQSAALFGRICAAPAHTSTGPAEAGCSRESNSCYPLAFVAARWSRNRREPR